MSARLPFITVITPSLNQREFIREAIESVRDQDYPNLEHLIIDGGSIDGTVDVLKHYSSLSYLRWLSEPDQGQSDAINKGLRLARSEIVGWLNADDCYYPHALHAIGNAFRRHFDAGLIYGSGARIDRVGYVIKDIPYRPVDRRRLRRAFYIVQPSMFIRRELFLAVGGLTPSTHWAMDWELLLKIPSFTPIYAIPDKIAKIRFYPETKSSSGGWERMREIALIGRKYNGLFDRNYVAFCVRERFASSGETLRRLVDLFLNVVFEPGSYMVRGWPD